MKVEKVTVEKGKSFFLTQNSMTYLTRGAG